MTNEALGAAIADALRGSWRASPPALALDDEHLAWLAPALQASGSAGLVCRRLEAAARERAPAQGLRDAYRAQAVRVSLREREIAEAASRLRAQGVQALLIKGWVAARAYAEPGLRPPGDVDLVVGEDQLDAARAALRPMAGLMVDLHAGAPSYADRSLDDLFARSEEVRVAGDAVRVPCPEDHLRLMCLHLLCHGGWRPIWLCDVAAAVEARPPGFNWERCLAGDGRRTEAVACVIALSARLLGADLTATPCAERAALLPRWLEPAVRRQWGGGLGASAHGPLADRAAALVRHPARWKEQIRLHWRNPVQASFEMAAPFNAFPRFPYQLAATLLRAPEFLRQMADRTRDGGIRRRRPAG